MKNKNAFTLIELIVVIVIIGILSGLAVVSYRRSLERSKQAEGLIALKAIYDAQMRYYTETGEFKTEQGIPLSATPPDLNVNDLLGIDIKNFKYFDSSDVDLYNNTTTTVATVRRDRDGDGTADYGITIDYDGDYAYETAGDEDNPGGLPE